MWHSTHMWGPEDSPRCWCASYAGSPGLLQLFWDSRLAGLRASENSHISTSQLTLGLGSQTHEPGFTQMLGIQTQSLTLLHHAY